MGKRNSNQIYGALGEYVLNNEEALFNEEQLKLVEQHKSKLKHLRKKSKREERFLRLQLIVLKSPSYILYFISNLCGLIALPFEWVSNSLNSVGVDYENHIEINNVHKKKPHTEALNKYAYKTVLPLLEELESEDMMEKHDKYLTEKRIKMKSEKVME